LHGKPWGPWGAGELKKARRERSPEEVTPQPQLTEDERRRGPGIVGESKRSFVELGNRKEEKKVKRRKGVGAKKERRGEGVKMIVKCPERIFQE